MNKKKLKQFFNRSYVRGGIYAIAPIIITTIFNKKYKWMILKNLPKNLIRKTSTPVWVLTILAIIIILLLVYFFKSIKFKKPKYLEYKKDKFEWLTYRWKYTGKDKNFVIKTVWAFCPECDCELVETSILENTGERLHFLKCPNCKFSCNNPFPGGDIIKIIYKRIRDKYPPK